MDSYRILTAAIGTQQQQIEKHRLTAVVGVANRPGQSSSLTKILVGNAPRKLRQQLITAAETNVSKLSEGINPQPEGCAIGHVLGGSDVFVSVTGRAPAKKRRRIAQAIAETAAVTFNAQ